MNAKAYANVMVLSPSGAIAHEDIGSFENALLDRVRNGAPGQDAIVLDLGAVGYMSSAGLRVLMLAVKETQKHQGALVVAAMQPTMQEIFAIARFDQVIPTYADVRSALAALSPAALAAFDGGRPFA
ncbi:MAG: STAS domain-containing protein [Pseudomonadota bacterium]|nr:STAS domain-containing protein [Pseudomonadota bacterium]